MADLLGKIRPLISPVSSARGLADPFEGLRETALILAESRVESRKPSVIQEHRVAGSTGVPKPPGTEDRLLGSQ